MNFHFLLSQLFVHRPKLPRRPQADDHLLRTVLAFLPATARCADPRPARARYMLNENGFLSFYGLRSVSRVHRDKPCVFVAGHEEHRN